ncbi:MAG: zinc-ribbon domain-containing protein [Chloroflexi bacterium]|nr:zinc-ribbon domain-containing protein [Chloroflexota bacterium]
MYCKYCGNKINDDAVICLSCGRQVALLKHEESNKTAADTIPEEIKG